MLSAVPVIRQAGRRQINHYSQNVAHNLRLRFVICREIAQLTGDSPRRIQSDRTSSVDSSVQPQLASGVGECPADPLFARPSQLLAGRFISDSGGQEARPSDHSQCIISSFYGDGRRASASRRLIPACRAREPHRAWTATIVGLQLGVINGTRRRLMLLHRNDDRPALRPWRQLSQKFRPTFHQTHHTQIIPNLLDIRPKKCLRKIQSLRFLKAIL